MAFDYSGMTPAEIMAAENVPKKRVRGDAVTRLCKATARHVRDNSEELARKLFLRALEGDINCSKLLVTLIEKIPPRKPRRRKIVSQALELALDREWDPERTDKYEVQDLQKTVKEFDFFVAEFKKKQAQQKKESESDSAQDPALLCSDSSDDDCEE